MTVHDFHFVCPKTWGIRRNGLPCEKWFGFRCIFGGCMGSKKGLKYFPLHLMKILRVSFHRKFILDKNLTIVAPSKVLAESMEFSLGRKVIVINNGVDIPKGKTEYSKRVLFMGRLTEDKGLQCISATLNNIKGYSVDIAGTGDYYEMLKSKYKNINFLGFQKNPAKFYKNTSIAIVPSIWMENFSYSVLEAMSYGICVIASNRGGIPEQIKDKKNGLLFEAGNEKDFSKKLGYLMKNPKEIRRMGENARKTVIRNWDWKIIVKQYEDIYKKLFNKFIF
jgi:glycosyltransferase involved in cell wall biosynthesis